MVNISIQDDKVLIALSGHIDSSNAPEVDSAIFSQNLAEYKDIIIDAENLSYVSSAGLRVILKIRKICPSLKIIGVNSEVYEVLEMTGFTEMIKVEKAYRKLCVDGCEILGEGSNGVVYRYNPEIVVKVYRNKDALGEIQRERRLARRALILGIPTAIPYDVVKVGEYYGSVFELLNAKSFSQLIKEEPDNMEKYISLFVELLKKIHATQVDKGEMSDMKSTALGWAEFLTEYLPKEQSDKLISLIKSVPDACTMIHGDYHTNNVEMQDGEVLLIDMDTLSFGHPIFELGSMYLGFVGFGQTNREIPLKFLKLPFETTCNIWQRTMESYLQTTDLSRIREVEEKAMIIAYARLMRRTIRRMGFDDAEGKATIEYCKKRLAELLPKVNSLDF